MNEVKSSVPAISLHVSNLTSSHMRLPYAAGACDYLLGLDFPVPIRNSLAYRRVLIVEFTDVRPV
jgi:hypothetical protein